MYINKKNQVYILVFFLFLPPFSRVLTYFIQKCQEAGLIFYLLNDLFKFTLWHSPLSHDRFAFHRNEQHGRYRLYAECVRQFLFFIYIHFVNIYFARFLFGYLCHDRSDHLAGSAPCGIEVYDGWFIPFIFEFSLSGIHIRNLFHEHGFRHLCRATCRRYCCNFLFFYRLFHLTINDLKGISGKDSHESDNIGAKFPEYGYKVDENVQEISDYSTNLATEKIFESTLKDIDNTLNRIKNGTYGICKYCQNPIAPKRLIARPTASSCIDCKTELQEND